MVYVRIGANAAPARYPHWDKVRQSQASLMTAADVAMIEADTGLIDNVHLDGVSMAATGHRAGDALLTMMSSR